MADLKLSGVDQSSGQFRPSTEVDSFVGLNYGIRADGDYLNLSPKVIPQYAWSSPAKLADPATLPGLGAISAEWSPNGKFLVVTFDPSPSFHVYYRIGSSLYKLPDPVTLPTGNSFDSSWSPDGELVAVAASNTPRQLNIYRLENLTLTRLSDPVSTPGSGVYGVHFSPSGEFLACIDDIAPKLIIYRRNGDTFTKLADPADLPSSGTNAKLKFSPDSQFLAVMAPSATTKIYIYQRQGLDTFVKLPDPVDVPTNSNLYDVSWSPDGTILLITGLQAAGMTAGSFVYQRSGTTFTRISDLPVSNWLLKSGWTTDGKRLAVSAGNSPYIYTFSVSNTTFTLLTPPSSLPTALGMGIDWTPDGQFLTIGYAASPYMNTYQTSSQLSLSGVVSSTRSVT